MSATGLYWFKSSYSGGGGGNCVEVAMRAKALEPGWAKSSYSGSEGDNCVEVALRPGAVLVRDSKDTQRRPLHVSPHAWAAFTAHTAAF